MIKHQIIYLLTLCTLAIASCSELPQRVDGGRVVAAVGERNLRMGEIMAILPEDMQGRDSSEFVVAYVNRWIARQIKVREAERIFSSSVQDIEAMVSSYRQALLTRKLDQYYINTSKEPPFEQTDVLKYYNANMNSFRLEKPIVKGRILQIPNDYSDIKQLKSLMSSPSEENQLNLTSICEKSSEFRYSEFLTTWIPYEDFMAMLPVVRGSSSDVYMKRDGVQELKGVDYHYLFDITGYRSAGYVSPLEVVEPQIRAQLTSNYQRDLIRRREDELTKSANRSNIVHRYFDDIDEEVNFSPSIKE